MHRSCGTAGFEAAGFGGYRPAPAVRAGPGRPVMAVSTLLAARRGEAATRRDLFL